MSQTEQKLTDEVLALHRQLAGEKLRADQGWARAEAKSRECIELRERMAAGPSEICSNLSASSPPAQAVVGGQPVTVGFDATMKMARRLIAEQLDDIDEEFMAGRAHGIGSLHSEILMLAKLSVLGRTQDETKGAGDAGAAQTCRSSEKVQVTQGQSGAEPAHLPPESGATLAPQSRQSDASATRASAAAPRDNVSLPHLDQLAFELPTGEPVIRNVGRNQSPENSGDHGDLAREALSAVSWLYRRLPHSYGRQQHIEVVIERLARETGTGIDELVGRGPDSAPGGAQ